MTTVLQFRPGDMVLIDLEAAQRELGERPCPACGQKYSTSECKLVLRHMAEGKWTVAHEQSPWVTCPFCSEVWRDSRPCITVQSEGPIEVNNAYRSYLWFVPRAWLRRVEV